ncbi:MAG: alpha/beta hydrolase, partial [Anabaena sp. MDT14b]
MSYINVRGVDHYYEWMKKPSDVMKPVMVFLHGWAGSARYWQSTAEALLDNFDCLLYDLRGFGRSQCQPHLSYELTEYAEDLAVLLNELNLDRVYINAHSMGASIATLFFNRYPQKVEKGILTCSGIFEYDEKAFSAFHQFGGYVVKFRPQWLSKIP